MAGVGTLAGAAGHADFGGHPPHGRVIPAGTVPIDADKADLKVLADVLARAFWDDPVMNYLIPAESTRYVRMVHFYRAELSVYLRSNRVITTPDHGAAALWAPPGRWRTPKLETLLTVPRLILAFSRNIPAGLRLLQEIEDAHPRDEHWYLGIVGADPARQGSGAGKAVIERITSGECDRDGLGAYLESSKERNIPYYERFGFQVTGELGGGNRPRMWTMWRDPR